MSATTTTCLVDGVASHPLLIHPDGSKSSLPFFADFVPGIRVLDVGCGEGIHLRALASIGCDVVGLEPDRILAERLQSEGFSVVVGRAEQLPFADNSFDAIVCSVVVPYTNERLAISEWARVVAPGGRVLASYHGIGYGLHYLLHSPGMRQRLYGLRMLLNTAMYRMTNLRLPGWMGDTLCQSSAGLRNYYRNLGLAVQAEYVHPGPAGFPRLIYHDLQRFAAHNLLTP